jgi:hypothetical protein
MDRLADEELALAGARVEALLELEQGVSPAADADRTGDPSAKRSWSTLRTSTSMSATFSGFRQSPLAEEALGEWCRRGAVWSTRHDFGLLPGWAGGSLRSETRRRG